MRNIADFDPLDRAMVAGRSAMSHNPDGGAVLTRSGGLLAPAVASVWVSTRTFRSIRSFGSYQRSV